MRPQVLFVAGEASGDHHGAHLLSEMRQACPGLMSYAAGGPALEKAGATIVVPMEKLSVIGFFEVASRLSDLYRAYRILLDTIQTHQIQDVILIDFPDFNLILARALKKKGVRVFYYISPQLWAWRKGRIQSIRRLVDHMFVIFPFEADFYRSHGIPVTYAGHPLLDSEFPPEEEKARLKREMLGEGEFPVLVLAPGSRKGEVSRLYPRMLRCYSLLRRTFPDLRAVVPESSSVPDSMFREIEERAGFGEHAGDNPPPVRIHDRFREVMRSGDCAIVASGTATLETGLIGTPMVVVYAMHQGTYRLARLLVKVPAIGMVNLVSGRTVVPELIQDQASPENMAGEVERILGDPERLKGIKTDLRALWDILGDGGASQKIARQIISMAGFDCGSGHVQSSALSQ